MHQKSIERDGNMQPMKVGAEAKPAQGPWYKTLDRDIVVRAPAHFVRMGALRLPPAKCGPALPSLDACSSAVAV